MMSQFIQDAAESKLFGENVMQAHEINDYQFIETVANGKQSFHVYVNGKRSGHAERTLDKALIVAIAYLYDGQNSQAAQYFARMIGMEDPS